ncbi:MAG: sulfatase-like hydrolase/transferase [Planctomycetes bacterium]|nr:sulfatase-like hydrolase/transferase [Planctomycetota bacterium]
MRRRDALRGIAGGIAALAWGKGRGADPAPGRKPNILWLMSDDHAAYMTGIDGNGLVRTPNIDRLARGGAWFRHAYCNSPMCTPSRQSYLTGRYPHATGVTMLPSALSDRETTLAEILSEAGYRTGAIGKMHFNSARTHGFEYIYDRGQVAAHRKLHPPKPVAKEIEVQPPWKPFKDPARIWLNARSLPIAIHDDDADGTVFARVAGEYIAQRARAREPFFLVASFYEPHSPFRFPVEFAGSFDPARFPVPEVFPEDRPQIPAIFRDLSPAEKKGIAAAYATSLAFMDRNLGRVLDALDRAGLAEETLVVYVGDNGYSLGHHGRFEKHTFYEESVRCPLAIRYPAAFGAGQTPEALAEFVDIVPTILDVAGLPVPGNVHGRSLRPILEGKAREHRGEVFAEYYHNEECMIRTARWKYIFRVGKRIRDDGYETGSPPPGRTEILFDLEEDPRESRNAIAAHVDAATDLRARAVERFRRTWRDPSAIPRDADPCGLLEWFLTHAADHTV